ncbi:hypothetical protein ACERK3_12615 [Phycisphaerales bacterium AB-hyl4]|uniref:Uncharacterized protein n=1 Tax=Natronomicrosphaera hydrolytica TaxID=3242702 RepID=A0ABV4U8I4_9BACT
MYSNNEQFDRPERDRPSMNDDAAGSAVDAPSRELVLVKKGQRFVFRCQPGEEAALLGQLRELVDDPEVNLSWFDVAVLSHQVGERLARRLREAKSSP